MRVEGEKVQRLKVFAASPWFPVLSSYRKINQILDTPKIGVGFDRHSQRRLSLSKPTPAAPEAQAQLSAFWLIFKIIRYRPMKPAQAGFAAGACSFSRRADERIAEQFVKLHISSRFSESIA